MSPGKRVSATDMLSRSRRSATNLEATSQPVDKSSSQIIEESTSTSALSAPVSTSASTSGNTSASTSVGAAAGISAGTSSNVVGETAARMTYAKVAVSLTPEQRQWLKKTPPALGVEGLSSSDLVRLALTRLRADIEDGLPLTDLLIDQAHAEAQQLTGRRNRGLPTR